MKTQPNNCFSMHGDPGNGRHFFINSVYGGCPKDAGWMVITVPPDCDWEKRGEVFIQGVKQTLKLTRSIINKDTTV